jgi:hypothetical protein
MRAPHTPPLKPGQHHDSAAAQIIRYLFFHPLQIWVFLTAVSAKASTRQNVTWHIGHTMVSNLRTLSVRTICRITIHLLSGLTCSTLLPQEHPSMASSSKAQGEPTQAPASDLNADMHALVGKSTGPTIRHQLSSSGPHLPGGTRPLNLSDQNPPRLAPRRPQRGHLTPPCRRPPKLSLARTLHRRAPRSTPVRPPGACWRLSSWPTSRKR